MTTFCGGADADAGNLEGIFDVRAAMSEPVRSESNFLSSAAYHCYITYYRNTAKISKRVPKTSHTSKVFLKTSDKNSTRTTDIKKSVHPL